MYYDGFRTLTYNCLFNFIVGNRGGGKTYWFKKWAIKDFIKNGNQFVYVRRYKQELKKISKFFDDIAHEFPNHKFDVKGMTFYIDNKLAGTAMPLSTSKIEKSTPFPKVNKIGFDEFILDKGVYRYLEDEVINFLELYETIARSRDNVIVFFLSNAISMTNPYFLYFNISLPYGKNIIRKDDILLELVQNQDFIDMKKQTRFGRLIEGTSYADYSIENKFLRDNKTFIEKKNGHCDYLFGFIYKDDKYGVWTNHEQGLVYVSYDTDPYSKLVYSITMKDHQPNTMLLKRVNKTCLFKYFIDNFKLGNVRFESMNIKNICYDILKLTI